MYLIVVGFGKIGSSLVELAVADGHDVVVVETDGEKATLASETYDCLVLHADATSNGTLEEAGTERADAVISTTDDDAVNIMVMLLAQEYDVPDLLSVVHEPRHLPVFEKIGVNVVDNPQRLIAQHLYHSVQYPSVGDYVELEGEVDLVQMTVNDDAPVAGRTLADAKQSGALPADVLVVAVKTGDQLRPPDGSTVLDPGDTVDLIVREADVDAAVEAFGPG